MVDGRVMPAICDAGIFLTAIVYGDCIFHAGDGCDVIQIVNSSGDMILTRKRWPDVMWSYYLVSIRQRWQCRRAKLWVGRQRLCMKAPSPIRIYRQFSLSLLHIPLFFVFLALFLDKSFHFSFFLFLKLKIRPMLEGADCYIA